MNTFQEWCKELLPIVQAGANGEEIEYSPKKGVWYNFKNEENDVLSFDYWGEYRIKPKTITVSGIEVPAPLTTLEGLDTFYLAAPSCVNFYISFEVNTPLWASTTILQNQYWLERGLCHKTKEAAIAHAKAMCGIKE